MLAVLGVDPAAGRAGDHAGQRLERVRAVAADGGVVDEIVTSNGLEASFAAAIAELELLGVRCQSEGGTGG